MSWEIRVNGKRDQALEVFQKVLNEKVEAAALTYEVSNLMSNFAAELASHVSPNCSILIESAGSLGKIRSNGGIRVTTI